jgi:hypothetical protein
MKLVFKIEKLYDKKKKIELNIFRKQDRDKK